VKTLSSRKGDWEGHSADAVADALFRIVLALQFRRRWKTQLDSVRKMLMTLTESCGEDASNECIVTADRGYGKASYMEFLTEFGFSSVFFMPDHLLRVHPFVGLSYLDPIRKDLEEEQQKWKSANMGRK